MNRKHLAKNLSYECKFKFGGTNVSQIIGGISINVDVSVKNFIYVKKIMFGIMLHVIVRMENIWQVLWMIQ